MAYFYYDKLWEGEFDNIVSKRDKLQDLKINELSSKYMILMRKDEKITKNFEAVIGKNVINKGFVDIQLSKINGHLSLIEKDYNGFKLQYNKQSVEEILFQRAVKTTIQILYDKCLCDNFQNADEVIK